jgi:hypothetical protein
MSRRRKVWFAFAAAILVIALALILAPRNDPYAFLRPLHPTDQFSTFPDGKPCRLLTFDVPAPVLKRALDSHWNLEPWEAEDGSDRIYNTPWGSTAILSIDSPPCQLTIHEEWPWTKKAAEWIHLHLHLN